VDGAAGTGARFRPHRRDEPVRLELLDGPVREGSAGRPHPAHLATAIEQPREGEAMGGRLSEEPEHDPLGQRALAHRVIMPQ
jgi:hypothetical protein